MGAGLGPAGTLTRCWSSKPLMTPSYSALPWQPGQQSPASMEARKAQCTRQQLAQLLSSSEYQQWADKKQSSPSKGARVLTSAPEYLLAAMALVVLLLLAVQPWVAPTATRTVSCQTGLHAWALSSTWKAVWKGRTKIA